MEKNKEEIESIKLGIDILKNENSTTLEILLDQLDEYLFSNIPMNSSACIIKKRFETIKKL